LVLADNFNAIAWAQFSAVDPDGEYYFFHSSGGALNWSNLVDERIDEGFEQARTSFDEEERAEGYAMVQEALAEQVPMLWFDHFGPLEGVAAAPDVHGFLEQHTVDGEPSGGFAGGSFFQWTEIWKG
jgi:ABC-type transport system substrate-binding protein